MHASPLHLVALSLTAALGAAACYPNAAGDELEQRIHTLEARQSEFVNTFNDERTRLADLAERAEARIVELETALNNAQAFLQRNNADLGAQVDTLRQEIGGLRGRLEEAQNQHRLLREELELMRQEFESRLSGPR